MHFEKYDDDTGAFHVSMSAEEIEAVREAIGLAWGETDISDWTKVKEFSSYEDITKLLNAWERHAYNPTIAYPEATD